MLVISVWYVNVWNRLHDLDVGKCGLLVEKWDLVANALEYQSSKHWFKPFSKN